MTLEYVLNIIRQSPRKDEILEQVWDNHAGSILMAMVDDPGSLDLYIRDLWLEVQTYL